MLERFSETQGLPHVLVVDDDERLRDLLSRFLRENGFLVSTAPDARQARDFLAALACDLVILDVMMPGEDGVALTRVLREDKEAPPVLLLTALDEVESRIAGLEAGADDYLAKPFDPRELLLRVGAILRRAQPRSDQPAAAAKVGRWTVDLDRGEIADGGERQLLTQVELTLLKALYGRRGEVVSREDLARLCALEAAERTIDVQVTRLRKKIEEDPAAPRYLQTARGRGYILWTDAP